MYEINKERATITTNYHIGISDFEGIFTYCLTKCTAKNMEIILEKSFTNKDECINEVSSLAKIFNSDIYGDENENIFLIPQKV